jgi:hypothetical protein
MDMSNLTLITLAWELYKKGVPKSHIAQRLGKQRETIHLWLKGVETHGLLGFLERYQQAKKGPRPKRQVDPVVKRCVWRSENERRNAVARRLPTSWSGSMAFTSRCPKSTRC